MRIVSIIVVFLWSLSQSVIAEPLSPHQRVEQVTQALLTEIEKTRASFDSNPDAYYKGIDQLLSPVIDFPSFTRSVMGVYGTREYYQSLADAEAREHYRENYQRFVETFKSALVQTYAKGMLAFNGQTITIEPPNEEATEQIAQQAMVDVVQNITSGADNYRITYKMRPNKQGEWLLRNVIIESVNVGQLYRNQFAAAMDKHQQNFAQVIDHWVAESAQATEQIKESAIDDF